MKRIKKNIGKTVEIRSRIVGDNATGVVVDYPRASDMKRPVSVRLITDPRDHREGDIFSFEADNLIIV